MRIQKFLRNQNIASLRKCDEFVQNKQVYINNKCLKDPTYYLKDKDIITYKDKSFTYHESKKDEKHSYYLFNKPKFVLCSHTDQFKRKIIFDFFKNEKLLINKKLFYAGRLDYLSRGLLILSTNGDFIQKITHPSNKYKKYYLVKSKFDVDVQKLKTLSKGYQDYKPFEFKIIYKDYVRIILHQGKKRQIRNIYKNMENEVIDLFRYKIGDYDIKDIEEGSYKEIKNE